MLAFPAVAPLIGPGLIGTHRYGDSPFLLIRLVALTEGLRRGELLPRWSPELSYGLGYPFFDFYGALAYYAAALLHFGGLPAVESLKLVQALGFLAASLASFALVRRHLGDVGGLVAAAVYGYAPYHLVNAYARGDSLGELTALAILPALLLAIEVASAGRAGGAIATTLLFAALILCHNLSALLAAPIVALWAAAALLVRWRSERRLPWRAATLVAVALALAVGLTTYYWLPVLIDRRYIHFEHNTTGYFDFRGHFLALRRLAQGTIVYDYGLTGTADGALPFQLGLAQALAALVGALSLPLALWRRREPDSGTAALAPAAANQDGAAAARVSRATPRRASIALVALLGLATGLGYLLLATPYALPLWERLEPLQIVQFPWRLLGPAALGLALVAALPGAILRGRWRAAWAAAVVTLAIVGGAWGATPERWRIPDADVDVAHVQQYEYLTSSIGSTVRYEYLPVEARERPWSSSYLALPGAPGLRLLSGQALRAEPVEPGGATFALRVAAPAAGPAVFEHHYFPGWRAFVDGAEVPVTASDPEGFLRVDLPAGEHLLTVDFGETRARRLARLASLGALGVAIAVLVALLLRRRRRGGATPPTSPGLRPSKWLPEREGSRAVAAVAILGALAAFGARAPWGELGVAVPDDGWNHRFAHEHAPWPYVEPRGVTLGAVGVLGYRQDDAVPAGGSVGVTIRTDGPVDRLRARLISPAEAIVGAPRTIASVEVTAGGPQATARLSVPAGTPPGLYQVELSGQAGQRWLLEPVRITPGSAPPATSALASFGGEIALEALGSAAGANATKPAFDLLWRAVSQPTGDWRVSARLVDDAGHGWGSSDGRPDDGFYPTRLWSPGELVRERRDLAVRPGTPPGRYRLELRLYSLNGAGLNVVDSRAAAIAPFYRSEPFVLGPGPAPAPPPAGAPPSELLEARVPAAEADAGTTAPLDLLWRSNAAPGRDLTLVLGVGPGAGQRVPAGGDFPASRWRAGEVVAAQPDLRVPLELPAGEYPVTAALVGPDGAAALGPTEIGRLRVRNRPRSFVVPPMQHPVGARLGDAIELLGYDLTPGTRVGLTVYWRATQPVGRGLTVFTHLLDAEGRVRGQVDSVPGGGALPTDGWAPGEVVADRYEIPLAAGARRGSYRVEVGMYDAHGGERLPVRSGGAVLEAGADHLILAAVEAGD